MNSQIEASELDLVSSKKKPQRRRGDIGVQKIALFPEGVDSEQRFLA
jgi:hypothetical protein